MLVHQFRQQLVLDFDTHAFVLHAPSDSALEREHIRTEFVPAEETLADAAFPHHRTWKATCCLGIATVGREHYVVVATECEPTSASPNKTGIESVASVKEALFFAIGRPDRSPKASDKFHPCHGLCKLITSGQCYIASDPAYDMTRRLKEFDPHAPVARDQRLEPAANLNFVANHAWLAPFETYREGIPPSDRDIFDRKRITQVMVHGFFGTRSVTIAGDAALLAVVSRRAWEREGTRLAERGIDAEGRVAAYAETETLLLLPDRNASFVQVRGSVSVFWSEKGTFAKEPALTLADVTPAEEQNSVAKHFEALVKEYGRVDCLDLLSPSIYLAERSLAGAYKHAVDELAHSAPDLATRVSYREVDVAAIRNKQGIPFAELALRSAVTPDVEKSGMTVIALSANGSGHLHPFLTVSHQSSVWRTNCRDCVDRTNLGQDQLSLIAFNKFVLDCYIPQMEDCTALEKAHRSLFADNGDALSEILTGAHAQNTVYLRTGEDSSANGRANKRTYVDRQWAWLMGDARKERDIRALEATDRAFALL